MITISDAAAEQIKQSSQQDEYGNLLLRLSARTKEDGSFDYMMGFDEQKESDKRVETNGVAILVAQADEPLLSGVSMDYVELVGGQHNFIFMNPNDPNYVAPKAT